MNDIIKDIQAVLKKHDVYIVATIAYNGRATMDIARNDKNNSSVSIGRMITSDTIFKL